MPRRIKGKAVSVWMSPVQEREYKEIRRRASAADRLPISGSFIVQCLLRAYAEGLVVPGLPTLSVSDTSDRGRGTHVEISSRR